MNELQNPTRRAGEWAEAYGSLGQTAEIRLMSLPVDILDPWKSAEGKRQPFKPYSKEKLEELAESIRKNGVIEPLCVRPKADGRFEIIAGHNRLSAAKLAGLSTVPVQIRQLSNEDAAVLLVDSNFQHREILLPSEKAFGYKLKLDAMKRQGQRTDLTSRQVGEKLLSVTQISRDSNESERKIQRYIRLTYLIPSLLDMVDAGKLKVNPGVELSYLTGDEQEILFRLMDFAACKAPSLTQAGQLRGLSKNNMLDEDTILGIMVKHPKAPDIRLPSERIRSFFPANATQKQIEDTICDALYQRQKGIRSMVSRYKCLKSDYSRLESRCAQLEAESRELFELRNECAKLRGENMAMRKHLHIGD